MSASITYVGHATVLIDMDGVRLLTDPVLRPRVMHLRRHGSVPADVLRGIDAVLVSHGHFDHLDLPSLDRLGREMPIICPRGLGGMLRRKRFAHVVEVESEEEVAVGAVTVTATPAEHDAARMPLGATAAPVGYVVSGSRRVYFAGDTDLFDGMGDLAPLDVALVPVAGWGPKVGPGHLDPERAARAVELLRPRIAIPIHWGTLAPMGRAPDVESPLEFARTAAGVTPNVDVRIIEPGELLSV